MPTLTREQALLWGRDWYLTISLVYVFNEKFTVLMDHSPIRKTFELGKFISTAGKSIQNLVKL